MPKEKLRRIAIIGSRAVGKSSLVAKYVTGKTDGDNYFPTIESTFTKQQNYKGTQYTLEILDTAGQDEFSIMPQPIAIHAYIFMFSITSSPSFNLLPVLYEKLRTMTGQMNVPCVIVGNKRDLENLRQVSYKDGEKLCTTLNGKMSVKYKEISVKNDSASEIERVFLDVLDVLEEFERGSGNGASGSGAGSSGNNGCIIL